MSHVTGIVTEHLGASFQSYTSARWDKLLLVLFQNINLPANNRLEVDLDYGTDILKEQRK